MKDTNLDTRKVGRVPKVTSSTLGGKPIALMLLVILSTLVLQVGIDQNLWNDIHMDDQKSRCFGFELQGAYVLTHRLAGNDLWRAPQVFNSGEIWCKFTSILVVVLGLGPMDPNLNYCNLGFNMCPWSTKA